jgi:hypothetical protein
MWKNSDRQNYLLIAVLVVVGVCVAGGLIIFIFKFFQATWNAPLFFTDMVFNILNFLLNVFGVVLSVIGPVAIILLLGYWIFILFEKLSNKLEEILSKINAPKETNIAPIVIAGFSGLFITVVKETTIPGDVKALLLLALGTITTILTMTTSQPKKTKVFGFVLLGVCVLSIIIFTIIRYNLFAPGQVQEITKSINDWFVKLTDAQYVSMGVFITFLILMIIAAIYYRKKPQSQ